MNKCCLRFILANIEVSEVSLRTVLPEGDVKKCLDNELLLASPKQL